jgi:diguanylate cyclase (GGDEF)-like protein/PAS domain S-box-containing protein
MGAHPAPNEASPPACGLVRNDAALITAVDDSIVDVLGWRPDQLIGSPSTALIHPDDQPSAVAAWFAMLGAPGASRTWRGRYRTVDGQWRWIEAVNTNRLDDPDKPGVYTVMRPAGDGPTTLEEELRSREELITRLADALPVGVFQIDRDRRLLFTNGRLHGILGTPLLGEMAGPFGVVTESDRSLLDTAVDTALGGQEVTDLELRFSVAVPHPDFDATRVCQLSLRPLTDGSDVVTGAIGCLSDVTDRVELRRELELRASTDGLTGCLNRSATFELLDLTLRVHPKEGTGVAVIFVDLDRFKAVNDRLGHAAGDRALLSAAETIRASVRTGDAVGRIGGDEFLVVCPAVPSAQTAVPVAERISESLREPLGTAQEPIELGASVGLAWTNDPGASPDSLIAGADAAMYQSKLSRVGRVVLAAAG